MIDPQFDKLSQLHALALCLWAESRGEPVEGQIAVGCVIRNRVEHRGKSYKDIIFQPWQFSCFHPEGGESNYHATLAMAKRVNLLSSMQPESDIRDPAWVQCLFIAGGIINGKLLDRTQGAEHYMTTALWLKAKPEWASTMRVACEIGHQVFLI